MSLALEYIVPGNDLAQLHDELLAAGLVPEQIRGETVYTENPPASGFFDADETVFLTMPDGTVEADVDTVVAAHVPLVRYDPATFLEARATSLLLNRKRADYSRLLKRADAAADVAAVKVVLRDVIEALQAQEIAALELAAQEAES